jgi:prepilin-type processing-associated H-X9-DG protein
MNIKHSMSLGFTRLDLLAVLSVASLLAVGAVGCLKRLGPTTSATECSYNLRVVLRASDDFTERHGAWITGVSSNDHGSLEWSVDPGAAAKHFAALMPDVSYAKYLRCPRDKRFRNMEYGVWRNGNISYFLSLNPDFNNPEWIVAGTRNISKEQGTIIELAPGRTPERWYGGFGLHGTRGYLAFADGHVHIEPRSGLPTIAAGNTNRIVLP